MTLPVLQFGLIDLPALIGPLVMGAGMWVLLAWHLDRHIVPSLTSNHAEMPTLRVLILIPFVLGLMLATVGFLSYIDRLWAGVLFLYALGHMIEAGAVVYGIRKLIHILRKLVAYLSNQSAGDGGGLQKFISYMLLKLKFNIYTSVLAVVFGGCVFFLSYWVADNSLILSLRYFVGVFAAISVGATLMWDIKKSFPQIEVIAAYGALLSIVGAELYEYQGSSAALAQQLPGLTGSSVRSAESIIPVVHLWDILTIGIGNLAFLFGLTITLFFLLSVPPIHPYDSAEEASSGREA